MSSNKRLGRPRGKTVNSMDGKQRHRLNTTVCKYVDEGGDIFDSWEDAERCFSGRCMFDVTRTNIKHSLKVLEMTPSDIVKPSFRTGTPVSNLFARLEELSKRVEELERILINNPTG